MPGDLPATSTFLSIREAADVLGVSLKTLRRWEKYGIVHPVRNPQNQRQFLRSEIEQLSNRKYKPLPEHSIAPQNYLSISQAADELGVSIKTLRRWDAEGKLNLPRDENNRRVFTSDTIDYIRSHRQELSKTFVETALTLPSPTTQLPSPTPSIVSTSQPVRLPTKPTSSIPSFVPAALAVFTTPLLSVLPFILVILPIVLFAALGYRPSMPLQAVKFPTNGTPIALPINELEPIASSSAAAQDNPILKRIPRGEVAGVTVTGGSLLSFESLLDDNYNFGVAGSVEGNQLISTSTIKPPLVVASQEKVVNLNADLLDGHSWEELVESAGGSGSTLGTLQAAYDNGNTIITAGKDISYTLSGSDKFSIGGSGEVNISSTGQVSLSGNIDALKGLDVTGADFTVGGTSFTVSPANGNVSTAGSLTATGAINLGSTGSTAALTGNTVTIKSGSNINLQANNETSKYIYFSTSSNNPGMFYAGISSENAPGIRVNNSTGQIEYRDQNSSAWATLDSLSTGSSDTILTDGGAYVFPTGRESLRVYSSTGANYIDIAHNGSSVSITTSATSQVTLDNNLALTGTSTFTLPNSNTMTGTTNLVQFSKGISVGNGTTFYFDTSGNLNTNSLSIGGTSVLTSARALQNITQISVDDLILNDGQIQASGVNLELATTSDTIVLKDNLKAEGAATISGTLSLASVSSMSDNNRLVSVNGTTGLVGYIDTTNWDKTSADDITSVTGTANQITASTLAGAVTLSLPQDIHTGASPTFAGLTLNGDLIPGTDAAYDLGSISSRFRDAYLSDSVHIGNSLILTDGGIYQDTGNLNISTNVGGTQTSLITLTNGGRVGIGTTAPAYMFEVAGNTNVASLYINGTQVTANATELNLLSGHTAGLLDADDVGVSVQGYNANTSFLGQTIEESELAIGNSPSAGFILQTDGSGNLSWADPSVLAGSTNYWMQTGEQIYSKNALWHDLMIGGTSTSSAKFYAQANTGNGYFSGRLGIGTTSPETALTVHGSIKAAYIAPPTNVNVGGEGGMSGCTAGSTVYFRVTALNEDGESLPSSAVAYTMSLIGDGHVEVYWDPVPGATSYRLYHVNSPSDTSGEYVTTTSTTANHDCGGSYASLPTAETGNIIAENRIGIGTTAPSHPLEVVSSTGAYGVLSTNSSALGLYSGGVYWAGTSLSPTAADQRLGVMNFLGKLANGSYNSGARIAGYAEENWSGGNTASGGYLRFDTTGIGSTANSERMRITASGNVGIGSTNPGYKLDVNGAINSTSWYLNGSQITVNATELNLLDGRSGTLLDTNNAPSELSGWDQDSSDDYISPLTSEGDLLYGGTAGAPSRLAGSLNDNYVLKYDLDTNTPFWAEDIDTDSNDYVDSLSFANGTLTLGRTGLLSDLTVSLDGRYVIDANTATWDQNQFDDVTEASIGATVQAYNANTSLLGQTIEESELNISNGPSAGYVLQTAGDGTLSWVDPSMFGGANVPFQLVTAGNGSESISSKNALWHDIFVGGDSSASATIGLEANTGNVKLTGGLYTGGTQRLSNTGALSNVSGNISMFTNDSGYITSAALAGYVQTADTTNWDKDTSDDLTLTDVANDGFIKDGNTNWDNSYGFITLSDLAGWDSNAADDVTDDDTTTWDMNIYDDLTIASMSAGLAAWDQNASDDVTTFIGLTDTPANYTDAATKVVRVNAAGTGLEFVDAGTVGVDTNDYVDTVSFSSGTLTLGRTGSLPDLTVNLDGRYVIDANTNSWDKDSSDDVTDNDTLTWDMNIWDDITFDNLATAAASIGLITDGNTNWDNSYGFITASSADALTNKSGNISMWTNDSGYITSAALAGYLQATDIGVSVQGYNANTSFLGQTIEESELNISNGPSEGYVLQTAADGTLSWVDPGTQATNYWQLNNQQISMKNSTLDLMLGGTSTTSATIALQATTGNALFSGNIGVGTTAPQTALHINGILTLEELGQGKLTSIQSLSYGVGNGWMRFVAGGTNGMAYEFRDNANALLSIGISGNYSEFATPLQVDGNFNVNTSDFFVDTATHRVGIGTTNPGYSLDVNGSINSTSWYLNGSQITASATELNLLSGHTAALLDADNLGVSVQGYDANTSLLGQTISESELDISNGPSEGYVLQTAADGTLTWVDTSTFGGTGYFQLNAEQISANNADWHDFLVGGTSTASATIALQANTGNVKLSSINSTVSAAELGLLDGRTGTLIDSNNLSAQAASILSGWDQDASNDFNGSWSSLTAPAADLTLNMGTYATTLNSAATTQNFFNLSGNSLTTGTLANFTSTSTGLTTGGLMKLDWSPSGSTEIYATGDLFSLNVGQYGNIGNIFNIKDNDTSVFSVSQTGITSSLPHTFAAAGDVAIANDLNFTNQDASYIKSNAPLYIEAGEAFESNNLTLRAHNSGNIILETATSSATLTDAGHFVPSSDELQDLGSPSNRWRDLYLSPNSLHIGNGTTNATIKLNINTGALEFDRNDDGVADFTVGATNNVSSFTNDANYITTAALTDGNISDALTISNGLLYAPTSGNIGVGTTAPTVSLDIEANTTYSYGMGIDLNQTGTGNSRIQFQQGGTGIFTLGVVGTGNTAASGKFFIGTTNLESNVRMAIDSTGNVGIGTTNPLARFHVETSRDSSTSWWLDEDSTALVYNRHASGDAILKLAGVKGRITYGGGLDTDKLIFSSRQSAGTVTESVTIDNNGNLGVGTTNPGTKLEVNGAVKAYSGGSTGWVALNPGDASNPGYVQWYRPDGTTRIGYMGWGNGGANNLNINLENSANFIVSNGNVGIGTTAPTQKLSVIGGMDVGVGTYGAIGFGTPNSDTGITFLTDDANKYRADIRRSATGLNFATSAAGVGTPPTVKLGIRDADNAIYAFGGWQSSWSDRRLKQDINPQTSSLEKILALNPVTYKWKPEVNLDDKTHYGIIAQEFQTIFPDMVYEDENGRLNVKRDELQFVLAKAIQELNTKVDANGDITGLQERITTVETKTTQLDNQFSVMSAEVTTQSNTLKDFVNSITSQINSLFTKQADLSKNQDLLQTTITDLQTQIASISASPIPSARVEQLETALTTQTAAVAGITTQVAEQTTINMQQSEEINSVSTRISALESTLNQPTASVDDIRISDLEAQIASLSAKLDNEQIDLSLPIDATTAALASSSAVIDNTNLAAALTDLTISPDMIDANSLFVTDFMSVMGDTVLTNVSITNTLTVGNINALDGKLNLMAGVVTIDSTGSVLINGNLTVTGLASLNQLESSAASISGIATVSGTLYATDIQSPVINDLAAQSSEIASQSAALASTVDLLTTYNASLSAKLAELEARISTMSATSNVAPLTPAPTPTPSTYSTRLTRLAR